MYGVPVLGVMDAPVALAGLISETTVGRRT